MGDTEDSSLDITDLFRRIVDERVERRLQDLAENQEGFIESAVGEIEDLRMQVRLFKAASRRRLDGMSEDLRGYEQRLGQVASGEHVIAGSITLRDHLNELEDRIAALEAGEVDYRPGAILQTPHHVDLDDADLVDIEDHREVAKVLDRVIRRHLEGVHLRVLVAGLVHAWLFEAQADSLQGIDTLRGARDALRGIFRDAAHMLRERSRPADRYTMEEFLADKEEGFDSGDE